MCDEALSAHSNSKWHDYHSKDSSFICHSMETVGMNGCDLLHNWAYIVAVADECVGIM